MPVLTSNTGSFVMRFKNEQVVYENEIHCRVGENEFNFTQNPTVVSGSKGELYDFVTASYFNPYVTTVGIYNAANELLLVAKLGQPMQISDVADTTFVIKYDT